MLDDHPDDECLCEHCGHVFSSNKTLHVHQQEFAYEIECLENGCSKFFSSWFLLIFTLFSAYSQALDDYLAREYDAKETKNLQKIVKDGFADVSVGEKTGRIYLIVDERMLNLDSDISEFIAAGFYQGSSIHGDNTRESEHKSKRKVTFVARSLNAHLFRIIRNSSA
jgi:hypothetical protein